MEIMCLCAVIKAIKKCMPHEFIRNMSVTFMEYFEYMLQNGFNEVELRIRRSFAAIALVDQKGNLYPLDMISIFEILKKYEKDIVFPGRLSSIERIYKWSNLYIHSGRGDYAWITYFLEKYLRPLSFGNEKPDGSWNYNNAISLTQKTYDKIEKELSELNDNFSVLKCKPECEIK